MRLFHLLYSSLQTGDRNFGQTGGRLVIPVLLPAYGAQILATSATLQAKQSYLYAYFIQFGGTFKKNVLFFNLFSSKDLKKEKK